MGFISDWRPAVFLCIPLLTLAVGLCTGRKSYPPGPRGYPIIGNLQDMPKEREWLTFHKWAKMYGELVYLSILGQSILILDSKEVAKELLEQRSSTYSSRPTLVMAGDLAGFNQGLALMPYTERFHRIRQLIKKELTGSALKKYWPLHERESRRLVYHLLSAPEDFRYWVRHYSGSVILRITYGYETASARDPFLLLAEDVMASFALAAQPGKWLVDVIPSLRYIPSWFPGASFKRKAIEWDRKHMQVNTDPYQWTRQHEGSTSVSVPNFVSTTLGEMEDEWTAEKDNLLLWAAGSLFGGGADTTVSGISSFLLYMAMYPEVQKQAQDEVDRITGSTRLPALEDEDSLQYVKNVMREILRLNPIAPLAVPHLSTKDDYFRGYYIPKGTIVIPNTWSMLHDPDIFPQPHRFNPSRFFGNDRAIKQILLLDLEEGQQFAESSMLIAIATIIAVCTIDNGLIDGKPIPSDIVFTSGTISHPPEFNCQIRCRSPTLKSLIDQEWRE